MPNYFLIGQYSKFGPDVYHAVPLFYALSGCDLVFSLYGKGKCKMFDTWLNSAKKKALTELFIQLGKIPTRTTERHMDVLKVYILEVYDFLATTLAAARSDSFYKSVNNDLPLLLTLTLAEISFGG